jgi:hypothetical protein
MYVKIIPATQMNELVDDGARSLYSSGFQKPAWLTRLCCPWFVKSPSDMPLHDDYRKILSLLMSLPQQTALLKALEIRFTDFLTAYFPAANKPAVSPEFAHWSYNSEARLPQALPLPSTQDLLQAKNWQAGGALTLFCYQQLLDLGYLDKGTPLDEALFYCLGHADPQDLHSLMKDGGRIFFDCGPSDVLPHGKYSHALQLIIIELAQKMGLIELTFPARMRVKALLHNSGKIQGMHGWDYSLEGTITRTLKGARGFNIVMLSIGKQTCPQLFRYLGFSYLKKLQTQMRENKLEATAPKCRDYLSGLIKYWRTNPILGGKNPEYTQAWQKRHHAEQRDKDGEVFIKRREADTPFSLISRRIQAVTSSALSAQPCRSATAKNK